ncbi:hypothetical protein Tco_0203055, partial [Tanacetum coccineum]
DTPIINDVPHPLHHLVTEDPGSAQSSSGNLASDALWCCFHTELSKVEPKKLDEDLMGIPVDQTRFRGMVGSLMYLTQLVDPTLYSLFACVLDIRLSLPKSTLKLSNDLKGTINMGLWYPKDNAMSLTAYADAEIMRDVKIQEEVRREVLSFLGWSSKKQRSTAISTTEAEYITMSGCCAQIVTPPNWVAAEYGSGACYFSDQ